MQTLERPTEQPPGGRRNLGNGWGLGPAVVLSVLALPVLLWLVASKWGVLVASLVAMLAGISIWVWRRGFAFFEVVAFLIHFDGLGFGPVRLGRFIAAFGGIYLVYKLVVERWRPPAIPTRHWVPVWLLTVFSLLSGAWSAKLSSFIFSMGLIGLALVFFGITGLLVDSHEKIQRYLRAFWFGGLWGSGAGVLALFLGTRSQGFGGDPNFFGLIQASMIPLTVYYRRNAKNQVEKNWYTLALMFVLAGAAGAGSRSGLIGAAVAVFGTMVTRPGIDVKQRSKVAVAALVMAALAFAVGFVANPNNLSRGFADRGAGRLDFWNVTVDLILERPVIGWGFGQLRTQIIPNLLVTPGVQLQEDPRADVSSHNTWMDIQGDLGAVGLGLFASIFIVTLWGFARPRWRHTKDLSTTLFVMMLPVLSSSNFVPLLNNKLAWSLFGLAAALQVPSIHTRWSGLAGPSQPTFAVDPAHKVPEDSDDGLADRDREWESPELARWDLRFSHRFRSALALGAAAGLFLSVAVFANVPTRYIATGGVVVPKLDVPVGTKSIRVDTKRTQEITTLAISDAYAAELKEQSGVDLTVPEIRDRLSVLRPEFGVYIEIAYTDTDKARSVKVLPHMVTALDAVLASSREVAGEMTADEVRPVVPGEQRYYDGPLYLRAYQDPVLTIEEPRTVWVAIVGTLTGLLVAAGIMLTQQRVPRVNDDDDLRRHLGLVTWAHVGGSGRKFSATRDQFLQVDTMSQEMWARRAPDRGLPSGGTALVEGVARRLVVSAPRADRAVQTLAMGVAAGLAAEGYQVVLVDAQVERPWMSLRLGAGFRPGLTEAAAGQTSVADVLRPVPKRLLPRAVRRALGDGSLQLVPAGRPVKGESTRLDPSVLEQLGPDVRVVVLAPPLLGTVPAVETLAWADSAAFAVVEGRTATRDAEEAAARARTFATGPVGAVLLDV